MRYFLITDGNENFSVLDEDTELIASSMDSMLTEQKLSVENCKAVKDGRDEFKDFLLKKYLPTTNQKERELWFQTNDWAQKVVSIMSEYRNERRFTKEQMQYIAGFAVGYTKNGILKDTEATIGAKIDYLSEQCEVTFDPDKRDADGNLILKRV